VLDDDGNEGNALPSSETLVLTSNPVGSDLPPYVVTEDEVDGFDLSDIDCTLNGVALDLGDIDVRDDGELAGVTLRLDDDDVAVCTFINVEESDDDPYDTYDDDPGDPDFVFQTPFENATSNPTPVEVAATTQPAVTQQPEQAQAPAVVLNETAQPAPGDAAPAVLAELPRTGSSARQATLVGGLLLITGGVASLIGRRRKAAQA
jgi:LPXTG-motif cell wall-anchored protein